jgi:alkanesulfonate monooxygenase SsuD/methylene tetrahydromethanopterin reductase-like flavin-dependent oxidoreductase (luciferase family)
VRLGLVVRNSGPDGARAVAEIPRLAEELGFDSVWVSDHLAVPESFAARYDEHWLEAAASLSYVAGITSRVRLGFSALILPYRPAALVASQVAAISELSGGRLTVGAGSGWLREEFEALGVSFARRGRLTDEAVRAIRAAAPGVELLAAGNGHGVLRRAAELCDGWHPIARTPEDVAASKKELDAMAGRPMRVVLRARFALEQEVSDRPLYGPQAKVRDDLARYEEAGVDEIALDYAQRTLDAILIEIRRFAEEVLS